MTDTTELHWQEPSVLDPGVVRQTWRSAEALHGLIYFAPEAHERYADFRERAPGARAVALTGRQSEVLGSPQDLEDALALQNRRLREEPDLVAAGWALFIVMPHEVEFWQGDSERRHHRLRYRRERAGWLKERLWP